MSTGILKSTHSISAAPCRSLFSRICHLSPTFFDIFTRAFSNDPLLHSQPVTANSLETRSRAPPLDLETESETRSTLDGSNPSMSSADAAQAVAARGGAGTKITPAEQAAYAKAREAVLRKEHNDFLGKNPDVRQVVADFWAAVLLHKPEDIYAFADKYFEPFKE